MQGHYEAYQILSVPISIKGLTLAAIPISKRPDTITLYLVENSALRKIPYAVITETLASC